MQYLYKMTSFCLFLFTIQLSSQTQDDYTLKSNQVSVFEKSKSLMSTIIKTGNILKWEQNIQGTSNIIEYTINHVAGHWDANTSKGNLTYNLIKEGFTKVTFNLKRTVDGNFKATLSVQEGDTSALQYTFNITNISYQ